MDVLIEPMRPEDLPEVLAIEAASFSIPWTREMFENELAGGDLAEVLVARLAGVGTPPPVAGYICFWIITEEMHINNLAIAPRWRRRGIAAALLEEGMKRGRARGARSALLEVRASNLAAQALYRQSGFLPCGVRRWYYDRPIEDAVIMKRDRL